MIRKQKEKQLCESSTILGGLLCCKRLWSAAAVREGSESLTNARESDSESEPTHPPRGGFGKSTPLNKVHLYLQFVFVFARGLYVVSFSRWKKVHFHNVLKVI